MNEQDANAAPRALKIARGAAPHIHLMGKIKPPMKRFTQDTGRTFIFAAKPKPEETVALTAPQSPALAPTESEAPKFTAEDEAALLALFDTMAESARDFNCLLAKVNDDMSDFIAELQRPLAAQGAANE